MAAVTGTTRIADNSWIVLKQEFTFRGGTILFDDSVGGVINLESQVHLGTLEEWITIEGTKVLFDPPFRFSSDEVKEIRVTDDEKKDRILLFNFTFPDGRKQSWKVDTSQRIEESNPPQADTPKRPLPQSAWKVPAATSPIGSVEKSYKAVLIR